MIDFLHGYTEWEFWLRAALLVPVSYAIYKVYGVVLWLRYISGD